MKKLSPIEAADFIDKHVGNRAVIFMFDSDLTIMDRMPPEQADQVTLPEETQTTLRALNRLEHVHVAINTGRNLPHINLHYDEPYIGGFSHGQYIRTHFSDAAIRQYDAPDFSNLDTILENLLKDPNFPGLVVEQSELKRALHYPHIMTRQEQRLLQSTLQDYVRCINSFQTGPQLSILPGNNVFEIGHHKASKGPATQAIKNHYPDHMLVAAGDAESDIEMLELADIPIIVGGQLSPHRLFNHHNGIHLEDPAHTRKMVAQIYDRLAVQRGLKRDPLYLTGTLNLQETAP
jgi:HAD superfamily hydrolase (TIGR01484 family)